MAGPTPLRVVSLIASATEIVCALGRRGWLVGRSHECDFPADVASLPALTAPKLSLEGTSADINRRVNEIVRNGLAVYRVEEEALRELAPDVIVTQDHCEVCAVSLDDVEKAICTWTERSVRVLSLRPDSTADVWADIRRVAHGLNAEAEGGALIDGLIKRIGDVTGLTATQPKPRVAFIEWVEPLMCGGNWMPELIEAAGGVNLFGEAGKHSGWMQWDEVVAADPDVIVVAPCGYDLARSLEELPLLQAKPEWRALSAVRSGRVYFGDGNAYFNRPGPRLADTTEIIAEMLHPDVVGKTHCGTAWVARTS